jgi:hypothetical protein
MENNIEFPNSNIEILVDSQRFKIIEDDDSDDVQVVDTYLETLLKHLSFDDNDEVENGNIR